MAGGDWRRGGRETVKWWAQNLVSTMRTAAASYHSQHYETSASISNASFDRALAPTRFSTLLLTAAWAWKALAIELCRHRTIENEDSIYVASCLLVRRGSD